MLGIPSIPDQAAIQLVSVNAGPKARIALMSASVLSDLLFDPSKRSDNIQLFSSGGGTKRPEHVRDG
jgi:hypothetical protein